MRVYTLAMFSLLIGAPVYAQSSISYSAAIAKAKTLAARALKDPDSARFRNLGIYKSQTGKGGVSVCGEINGRNSFGGYVGYRGFVVSEDLVAIQEADNSGMYSVLGPALCHELVRAVK